MGAKISSIVFRPPRPTPIPPSEYFYLDVDVHSPLCTNKRHTRQDGGGCNGDNGSCGSTMCLDTGESDLASLDASFISNAKNPLLPKGCYNRTDSTASNSSNTLTPSGTVPNMKNGKIYKIPAFFIRRRGATQTILFSHGNAEDLGMMYNRMKDLAMILGVNILAYDYTGYGLSIPGPCHGNGVAMTMDSGRSTGSSSINSTVEGPSENMCYRNIEAAFRYLTETRKIPASQIILYGRSLGSGPSCYLAAKTALTGNSCVGLILHSPFLSVYKIAADLNGLNMLGDIFNNEKRAKNVRCPTLIIHGKDDEVVPFFHSQRLLAAIPKEFQASPYYVENMGHNHIESKCREKYIKTVLNFIQMNVWNSNRPGKSYGVANTTSIQEYRGPLPIPMHERASSDETKEEASFYVNKTWLLHAKVLISTAIVDAGCSVNTSSDVSNDSHWTERSGAGQRSTSTPGRTSPIMDRYSMGMSDARDDEDEMAPWRSNQKATRKATKVLTPRLFASRGYNRAQSSSEIKTGSILKSKQSPRRSRKTLDLMHGSRQGGRI